jgi:drug/metabolite transporter (DMT)-like permease
MSKYSPGKKFFAVGGILIATIIWGSSFPIVKIALESFTPLWFVGIRFCCAALLMLLICAPRLKRIDRGLLRDGMIAGLPVAAGYALQTIGLLTTTATNNAFITCTYVVLVPFVMWAFGKKIRAANFLIAFITLAGLAILSLHSDFRISPGDIWTLGCAFFFALHLTLLGEYSPRHDAFLLSLIQIAMVGVINILLALLFEPLPGAVNFSQELILALIFCALFPTVTCYLIQTAAQKIISPVTASVLFMAEAVFGAFFGWLLLDEILAPRQLLGAAILIVCMTATVLLDNQPGATKKVAELEQNKLGK